MERRGASKFKVQSDKFGAFLSLLVNHRWPKRVWHSNASGPCKFFLPGMLTFKCFLN